MGLTFKGETEHAIVATYPGRTAMIEEYRRLVEIERDAGLWLEKVATATRRADAAEVEVRRLKEQILDWPQKVAELEAQIAGLSDANRRLAETAQRAAKDVNRATTTADEAQQDAYDLALALLRSRMSKRTAAAVVRTLDAGNVKL